MTDPTARELTIHDVARLAGVSPATVSRVITGRASVSAEKAIRVRAAIDSLGYRPNPFARGLLGHGTSTVGVLVPQLEDEFYGKIVTGIESALRANDLHMLCSLGHDRPSDEQAGLDIFRERQVDGLILLADRVPDSTLIGLAEQKVPVVLVNRFLAELGPHCLRLDNVHGGLTATNHLLELGHRRIAHITGVLARPGSRERHEGYRLALLNAGIERDDNLVVEGDFSEDGGRAATERLLKRTDFTAVFAASDRLALGVLSALSEAGLRVPKDVSVVGYDDRSIARFTNPPLTTLHYPMLEMGFQAAEHLIALIRGQEPTALSQMQATLVVRASTAPARSRP
jgi:LacI family transcriptional regulator